jgi:hypothetical protein
MASEQLELDFLTDGEKADLFIELKLLLGKQDMFIDNLLSSTSQGTKDLYTPKARELRADFIKLVYPTPMEFL